MAIIRPPLPQMAFTMIPNAWVRDADLDPNAFRVLAVILSHAEGYRLSVSQIMRESGIGRDGVEAAVRRMRVRGYLVAVEQPRGERGRFGENDYTVTSVTDRVPPLPSEPSIPSDPELFSPNVGAAPLRSGTATVADRNGAQPPYKKNALGEDQEPLSVIDGGAPLSFVSPEPFDVFWGAYPRKVGKDAARRAWRAALRRAPSELIIQAVKEYPFSADLQYVPHAATWLNGGRWADDPAAVRPRRDTSYGPGLRPSNRPEDYHDPGWHSASADPPEHGGF